MRVREVARARELCGGCGCFVVRSARLGRDAPLPGHKLSPGEEPKEVLPPDIYTRTVRKLVYYQMLY